MDIAIALTPDPIQPPIHSPGRETGAVLEFQGLVRGSEGEVAISALQYEVYEPMAGKVLREILEKLGATHPCQAVTVIHRYGLVPVGEPAIFVRVESAHRGEGLALLEEFMKQLKTAVPIWKVASVKC
mgnify:FL=1|jgi:molybdopterin synthase catalytic subunit